MHSSFHVSVVFGSYLRRTWFEWNSGDFCSSISGIHSDILDLDSDLYRYASAGHYNDMDMLQVGRGMTYDEDKIALSDVVHA